MSDLDDIRTLLREIRDGQARALEAQEQHLEIARQQLERARRQVDESLALQRESIARQKSVSRIAFPAILACIALIAWLVLRYL